MSMPSRLAAPAVSLGLAAVLRLRACADAGLRGLRAKALELHGRLRIYHFYYLLAAFDVAAVFAGLFLTHQVIGSLTATVRSNLEWGEVHDRVDAVRALADRINAPSNDVFENRDAAGELIRLEVASADIFPLLAAVRRSVRAKLDLDARREVMAKIDGIDAGLAETVSMSKSILRQYATGGIDVAGAEMAVSDRRYRLLLADVESAGQMLRRIENDLGRETLRATRDFRHRELLIAGLIVVMVFCLTFYGHQVSRMFERQHRELALFNATLESRVAERTAELATSQAETARQKEELRQRNIHFDCAINNMNRGLCLFDGDQRLIVANDRFFEMYDLKRADAPPGTAVLKILELRAAKGHFAGKTPESYYADRLAVIAEAKTVVGILSLPDGRVLEVGHHPIAGGGWVATHDDITDRRRMEQQIVHLAHHDALTGLPNRRKLKEELDTALKRTERGDRFAVLCLDLDHFKQVNDTLGHPIGDRLLQCVADRLRRIVRKSDLVARMGGDEFAIIQFLAEQPVGSTTLAMRIIEEVSQPYEVDGHQLVIGTSVGIALAPDDGDDANALLKNADLALYRSKSEGKGVYRLFEVEMDARAKVRRRLELDLRRAVVLGEFELYYQPLILAGSGSVAGFEALLRWRHAERGMVSPADFIPLAEEIGLMGDIGAWVLEKACEEATQWPSHCRVAVNISPAQFRSRPLDHDVLDALRHSGLAPERLELEITESVLLENTDSTMSVLHRLRDCGVKIAMDDFGTGYSSLSYLHTFPFDKIKIDRSFTQSAGTSSSSLAIVQAVLGLGKNLGMSTTAEGVETTQQLEHLRNEGCVEVQGFLFSRPVPAHEIPRLLDDLKRNACHEPAEAA